MRYCIYIVIERRVGHLFKEHGRDTHVIVQVLSALLQCFLVAGSVLSNTCVYTSY